MIVLLQKAHRPNFLIPRVKVSSVKCTFLPGLFTFVNALASKPLFAIILCLAFLPCKSFSSLRAVCLQLGRSSGLVLYLPAFFSLWAKID